MPPEMPLSIQGRADYIRPIMNNADAIVLTVDLFNKRSWEYIDTLGGFPEGKLILLVACNCILPDWQLQADHARDFANARGWHCSTIYDVDSAFNTLMTKVSARPPSRLLSPALGFTDFGNLIDPFVYMQLLDNRHGGDS
ncbi:hypothetical protein F4859DRAFT_525120 [Xylaria cf. heliscus]|nr:hypothetical protein F4859DRAFT_525120 [Xylaria cf. heliscus]